VARLGTRSCAARPDEGRHDQSRDVDARRAEAQRGDRLGHRAWVDWARATAQEDPVKSVIEGLLLMLAEFNFANGFAI
jgi:hypothetical protein